MLAQHAPYLIVADISQCLRQQATGPLAIALRGDSSTSSKPAFRWPCHSGPGGPPDRHLADRRAFVRRNVSAISTREQAWSSSARQSPGWTFLGGPTGSPLPALPLDAHWFPHVPTAAESALLQRSSKSPPDGPCAHHGTIRLFLQLGTSCRRSGSEAELTGRAAPGRNAAEW